jgi:hypothetical protein
MLVQILVRFHQFIKDILTEEAVANERLLFLIDDLA